VDGLDDDDPRVALAAAAALLDRVGMVKGAAAPSSADTAAGRLRRMTDAELEQEIARLQAEASRGRVVIYLPPEDPATD